MITIPYPEVLSSANIRIIREIIEHDGLMAYPTDTLYGLGGNYFSEVVYRKINRLKKREDLPYSVVVGGLNQVESLAADIPAIFYELAEKLLPGKFTLLLKRSPSVSPPHLLNQSKVGIRIPAVQLLLKLVGQLNVFLFSTSVNHSGEEPLNHPRDIQRQFPEIDLLIDMGPLPPSTGSTVLDLTRSPVHCIRKGDDFPKLEQIGLKTG